MYRLVLVLIVAAPFGLTACASAQDAMVAARDPQTGQLRPATPAELRALGTPSLALRPPLGPVKLRSDGRRELHLGEAALVHAVLRREADGSVTMRCVDDEHLTPRHEASHADR